MKIPKLGKNILNIPLILVVLQLLLLLWSDFIFGTQAPIIKNVLLVYLVMEILVIVVLNKGRLTSKPITMVDMIFGAVFFVITSVIVYLIRSFSPNILGAFDIVTTGYTIGLIGYVLVKALIEEIVFRDALGDKLGMIGSSLLFGAFHIAILSTKVGATVWTVGFGAIFLTAMGMVWWFIWKRFGLMSAVFSHLAWNMGVLGLLGMLYGGI